MHHRTRSIVLAALASTALMVGSLAVGIALKPDTAEGAIAPQPKVVDSQPTPIEYEIPDEPAPHVITIKEVVIYSKRVPTMRPGTMVRDPRPVPAMGCSTWKDSLVGGQYRVCEVQ